MREINTSSVGLSWCTIHWAHGNMCGLLLVSVHALAGIAARVETLYLPLCSLSHSHMFPLLCAGRMFCKLTLPFFFFSTCCCWLSQRGFWGRNRKDEHILFRKLRGPALKLSAHVCTNGTQIIWLHEDMSHACSRFSHHICCSRIFYKSYHK